MCVSWWTRKVRGLPSFAPRLRLPIPRGFRRAGILLGISIDLPCVKVGFAVARSPTLSQRTRRDGGPRPVFQSRPWLRGRTTLLWAGLRLFLDFARMYG